MKPNPFHYEGAELAHLLRALASLIEKSSAQEIAALLDGQASLFLKSSGRAVRSDSKSEQPDLPLLANRLQALNSREDGEDLLASLSLTRRNLEGLGRLLGVAILKTDNIGRLTEKVIEATIGARLNSEAIRGEGSRPTL